PSVRLSAGLLKDRRADSTPAPMLCAKPPCVVRAKYAKYAKYGHRTGRWRPCVARNPRVILVRHMRHMRRMGVERRAGAHGWHETTVCGTCQTCPPCHAWAADRTGGGHVGRAATPAARARISPDLRA